MTQVAFAEGVFTWPSDDPQLIGGRCAACDAIAFPRPVSCPRCGTPDPDEHLLPRRGTLWTFTTQEFLPKEPYASGETMETFRPYGVGLVELGADPGTGDGGEVRVESRLTEADASKLRIGMEMELVVVPFRTDDDGTEIVTYAFSPVGGGSPVDAD